MGDEPIFSNIDFKKCMFKMEDLHKVRGYFIFTDNAKEGCDKSIEHLWFKSDTGALYLIDEKITPNKKENPNGRWDGMPEDFYQFLKSYGALDDKWRKELNAKASD